jgi:hypothetical protein
MVGRPGAGAPYLCLWRGWVQVMVARCTQRGCTCVCPGALKAAVLPWRREGGLEPQDIHMVKRLGWNEDLSNLLG